MPLVNAPNRGYADWQRVSNWDTAVLYSSLGTNIPAGGEKSPVLDVSRYAYLSGYDKYSAGSGYGGASWFSDAAGGNVIGARTFSLDSSMTQFAQYRLPNLGPYVKLSWFQIGATQAVHSAQIMGTNRYHPCEFIPGGPSLVTQSNQTILAGGSLTVAFTHYYSGPCSAWFSTGAQPGNVAVQYLDTGGVWQYVFGRAAIAANSNDQFTFISPPGALRCILANTGTAAANYYCTITPSFTGSS